VCRYFQGIENCVVKELLLDGIEFGGIEGNLGIRVTDEFV